MLPEASSILIQVPSEMAISSSANLLLISPSSSLGFITPTVTDHSISFNSIVLENTNLPSDSTVQIILTTFTLPSTLAETSSFSITTYSGGYVVDSAITDMTFQATTAGALKVNTLSANDTSVAHYPSYFFSLALTSSIPTAGAIYIKFPSTITLTPSCSIITPFSSNLDGGTSKTCTPDTANNYILLADLFTTTLPVGQTISFTLLGFQNPSSIEPTSALEISSLQDSNSLASIMDSNKTQIISFITPGIITPDQTSVVPTSLVITEITTYTFSFNSTNICPTNGALQIQILKGYISLPQQDDTKTSLASIKNINPSASVTIQETTSYITITLTNAFNATFPSKTLFSFSLGSIQNPPSTQPFSGINFTTLNPNNYAIDTMATGAGAILEGFEAESFSSISIIATSLQNNLATSYQIKFTLTVAHAKTDKFTITFPSELTLTLKAVTLLTGSTSTIKVSTSSQTSNSAIITFSSTQSTLASGSVISLSISSLKNPKSVTTIGQFTITSTDSNGFIRSQSIVTNSSLVTVPATLSFDTTSVTPANTLLNNLNTPYEFEMTCINQIDTGGFIDIVFPSEISVPSSPLCTSLKGITSFGCTVTPVQNKITITGTFTGLTLDFMIYNVTNPAVSQTSSFMIYTKTSAGSIIDQRTTDLIFNALCENPCKTCITSKPSECITCFTDSSSALKYLWGSTCVDSCPSGVSSDGLSCLGSVVCDSSCKTCSGPRSTQCTSCSKGYLNPDNTCASTCPTYYYGDKSTKKCKACAANCEECFGSSANQCSACISPYLLYKSSCVEECPVNVSIQIGDVCETCDYGCATCFIETSNCTSCLNGFTLKNLTTAEGELSFTCLAPASDVVEEKIAPFPFLIVAFILASSLAGVKKFFKETDYFSNIFAIFSFLLSIAVMVLLSELNTSGSSYITKAKNNAAIALVSFGLFLNYLSNAAHTIFILKLLKKDKVFSSWKTDKKSSKRTFWIALVLSAITTFASFRVIYGRIFNREYFSAKFESDTPLKKVRLLTVLNLAASYLSIFIGTIIRISAGWQHDQASVTCIEVIIIGVTCCGLQIFEYFYKFKKADAQSKSKAAIFVTESLPSSFTLRVNGEQVNTSTLEQNKSNLGLLDDDSRLGTSPMLHKHQSNTPSNFKNSPQNRADQEEKNTLKTEGSQLKTLGTEGPLLRNRLGSEDPERIHRDYTNSQVTQIQFYSEIDGGIDNTKSIRFDKLMNHLHDPEDKDSIYQDDTRQNKTHKRQISGSGFLMTNEKTTSELEYDEIIQKKNVIVSTIEPGDNINPSDLDKTPRDKEEISSQYEADISEKDPAEKTIKLGKNAVSLTASQEKNFRSSIELNGIEPRLSHRKLAKKNRRRVPHPYRQEPDSPSKQQDETKSDYEVILLDEPVLSVTDSINFKEEQTPSDFNYVNQRYDVTEDPTTISKAPSSIYSGCGTNSFPLFDPNRRLKSQDSHHRKGKNSPSHFKK